MRLPLLADLERIVTNRSQSYFATDVTARRNHLEAAITGRRILVVGGGGSIGSATARALLEYRPAAVHVVDLSENYLAELIRDARSGPEDVGDVDLQTHVFDYGGPGMRRFLSSSASFDFVMNFAAVKHVRSEKDIYSLLYMLDVNIIRQWRFKQWLAQYGHTGRYFTVSSDKAANPASLMGASKRVTEDVAFEVLPESFAGVTSARFANVAFSNGSLLQSFVVRLQKRQPLAVPAATRRYFISHSEAAHICLLASFVAPSGCIVVPAFEPSEHLILLEDLAVRVVRAFGFEPWITDDESSAKQSVALGATNGRWPILRTALDTSGEKSFEEFVADDEYAEDIGFTTLRGVRHRDGKGLDALLQELQTLVDTSATDLDKEAVIRLIGTMVPTMRHVETGRHLDQRM